MPPVLARRRFAPGAQWPAEEMLELLCDGRQEAGSCRPCQKSWRHGPAPSTKASGRCPKSPRCTYAPWIAHSAWGPAPPTWQQSSWRLTTTCSYNSWIHTRHEVTLRINNLRSEENIVWGKMMCGALASRAVCFCLVWHHELQVSSYAARSATCGFAPNNPGRRRRIFPEQPTAKFRQIPIEARCPHLPGHAPGSPS